MFVDRFYIALFFAPNGTQLLYVNVCARVRACVCVRACVRASHYYNNSSSSASYYYYYY